MRVHCVLNLQQLQKEPQGEQCTYAHVTERVCVVLLTLWGPKPEDGHQNTINLHFIVTWFKGKVRVWQALVELKVGVCL